MSGVYRTARLDHAFAPNHFAIGGHSDNEGIGADASIPPSSPAGGQGAPRRPARRVRAESPHHRGPSATTREGRAAADAGGNDASASTHAGSPIAHTSRCPPNRASCSRRPRSFTMKRWRTCPKWRARLRDGARGRGDLACRDGVRIEAGRDAGGLTSVVAAQIARAPVLGSNEAATTALRSALERDAAGRIPNAAEMGWNGGGALPAIGPTTRNARERTAHGAGATPHP